MMKVRYQTLFLAPVVLLALAGWASADTKAPVSGTWSCVAHGTGQGDMEYTFNLNQSAEQVTGNFTAPSSDGGNESHDVKDGSFKAGKLTLHFEDDDGTIDVTGGLDGKDAMKGDWTQGNGGGTWDCKRGAAAADKH